MNAWPSLSFCALAVLPASGAEITVHRLQDNKYEFVLTNATVLAEREALTYIASAAASLCKPLTPVPGKYRFEATQKVGGDATAKESESYRFTQEVSCVLGASQEATPRRPILATAEESRQLQEEVKTKSELYLQQLAAGRVDEAYAQVSAERIGVDALTWKGGKLSFHALAGEPVRISISKVTVYDNPAEAPEPGLYVAADFSNEYRRVPIHCGYLMWFRPVGGRFQITREENGYVTAEQLKAIPATDLPEIKQKLRCVAP